jgi:6-phosphogluconolactonase
MNVRRLVLVWGALSVLVLGCAVARRPSQPSVLAPDTATTFVYAAGASGDIAIFQVDRISGRLTAKGSGGAVRGVATLAGDPQGRYLYAGSDGGGEVAAFAVRARSGALAPLGKAAMKGGAGALAVHRNGKYLLAASLSQVAVFPVKVQGGLGVADSYPSGGGTQAVAFNPQLDHVSVLNSGAVAQFAFNTGTGILTESRERPVTFPARSLPRKLAFHPSGRFAYVLQEGAGVIAGYTFEATSGTLSVLSFQTVALSPIDEAAGTKAKAVKVRGGDLRITPSGRHLFTVDRNHKTVATYAIDPETGNLSLVGYQDARGQPRALTIVEGKLNSLLVVAHQDTLATFNIDGSTGTLAPAGTVPLRLTPVALAAVTVKGE